MPEPSDSPRRVLLTGATGFVGGHVLRELLSAGYAPVCLVRDQQRFEDQTSNLTGHVITTVQGSLGSPSALAEAAGQSDMAIHLVGIIMQRGHNTFSRVHYEGTRNVVDACNKAGIRRYVHMSALGTRPNAVSKYHQTKYMAEQYVKKSGLHWTIMRPSIIHGPNGEFMELLKTFACGLLPPVMPYFGDGSHRLQPADVRDVAECFVRALSTDAAVHKVFDLGGPRSYSWKELYRLCQRIMPGAKKWKPIIGQPVPVAKALAATVMKIPAPGALNKLRFNVGQVQMSQEDSVCDIAPAEKAFEISFRDFETELALYADQIR